MFKVKYINVYMCIYVYMYISVLLIIIIYIWCMYMEDDIYIYIYIYIRLFIDLCYSQLLLVSDNSNLQIQATVFESYGFVCTLCGSSFLGKPFISKGAYQHTVSYNSKT